MFDPSAAHSVRQRCWLPLQPRPWPPPPPPPPQVVDTWYKFLATVRNNTEELDILGEAQLAEAMEMLRQILETRTKFLGESHIATGEACYTLGLLHLFVGKTPSAQVRSWLVVECGWWHATALLRVVGKLQACCLPLPVHTPRFAT